MGTAAASQMHGNNGALLETLAAQELSANGYSLRYFDKSRYGEVDFVLPKGAKALPVELKSGASYRRHKALNNILAVLVALVIVVGMNLVGMIVPQPRRPKGHRHTTPWREGVHRDWCGLLNHAGVAHAPHVLEGIQ